MRLSDVKGERSLDVIADLIEPVVSLATSDEFKAAFKGGDGTDNAERLRKHAPLIIKAHKREIVTILSTIEGVSTEEYEEGMTIASVISDIAELMTDDAFTGFLASVS